MLRVLRQALGVGVMAALTSACATAPPPPQPPVSLPTSAGVYKIGNPYEIAGTWYYPREQPTYDQTGIASWYGPTFYGKPTADGETFNADALTAAHRTLPMPVNVRVTNLENGRSLVLRVNDRGPFAKGRIIDVSERAARLLGFYEQGTARVEVKYLGRADLPNGEPQAPETPVQVASALPAVPAGAVAVQRTQPGYGGCRGRSDRGRFAAAAGAVSGTGQSQFGHPTERRGHGGARAVGNSSLRAGGCFCLLRQCAAHDGAPQRGRRLEDFFNRQGRQASL